MYARRRFWYEAALASTTGLLAILTLVWPAWIEGLTGIDPDHGNGSGELFVTVLFAALAIALATAARMEWQRARSLATRT